MEVHENSKIYTHFFWWYDSHLNSSRNFSAYKAHKCHRRPTFPLLPAFIGVALFGVQESFTSERFGQLYIPSIDWRWPSLFGILGGESIGRSIDRRTRQLRCSCKAFLIREEYLAQLSAMGGWHIWRNIWAITPTSMFGCSFSKSFELGGPYSSPTGLTIKAFF